MTGAPIKFAGIGEKIEGLEVFHPERMAGRILGMGDVVSLVEEAQRKFDQEEMKRQEERLKADGDFQKIIFCLNILQIVIYINKQVIQLVSRY